MSKIAAGRKHSVSPKRALGHAIQRLGANATHRSLVDFAEKEFGARFQFMLVLPRESTANSTHGKAGHVKGRKKAG